MRLLNYSILGGFLIGLTIGCSGGSDQVEIPKNPSPLPKNPPVESPQPGDSKKDSEHKRLPLPPTPGKMRPEK